MRDFVEIEHPTQPIQSFGVFSYRATLAARTSSSRAKSIFGNGGEPMESGPGAAGTQQSVSGAGSFAANLSGGSQLHVGDVNVLADSQYSSVKLDEYGPESWVDPPRARDLVRVLAEHRLLILAGSLEEKTDCARHIAYLLRAQMESGTMVRERCPGREPQRIETAFDVKHPTILLLPEVSPVQIVGYSPRQMRESLRLHQAFAIITTDCSRSDWEIDERSLEAKLFCEISWDSYYGAHALGEFLVRQLRDPAKPPIHDGVLPEGEDALLAEGITLAAAAGQLKTPGRVRSLVEWIFALPEAPSPAAIAEQLARLSGDDDAVRRWFRQLTDRDQLLGLGLALFDGLEDAALFDGLELLVETCWRATDPLMPQFDYCDLERFSAYFKQVPIDGGLFRIESSSPQRRRQILDIVWSLQRRHLLATLPALTEMIRQSVASSEPEPETSAAPAAQQPAAPSPAAKPASGAPERRPIHFSTNGASQLHQVLVDSLSVIRLMSVETVKPYLRNLASDRSAEVQRFVARALAAWRDSRVSASDSAEEKAGGDLCELLADWWSGACKSADEESTVGSRSPIKRYDSNAALRTTIALTVGFAAKYDRPNQLAHELYLLVWRLFDDNHPRVREQMLAWTIPLTTAFHLHQLDAVLQQRIVSRDDLMGPVARGAALACSLRAEESLAVLARWREAAQNEPPKRRERLLGTVALTFGYIECQATGPLSPEAVLGNLKSLLEAERYPDVRYWIFYALEQQAKGRFETVAALLQDFLAIVTVRDRPLIVKIFAETYLSQREQLRGGDDEIEVDGHTYSIWTASARPLTEIEASLYSWMMDESRPIAQQLAIDVFSALGFSKLERAERERRAPRQQPVTPLEIQHLPPLPAPQFYPTPFLGDLALLATTRRKPRVRPLLKPLLAELIVVGKASFSAHPVPSRHDRVENLFSRWAGASNQATRAVAKYLRGAFTLYRWRWGILCGGAFFAFLLYQTLPPLLSYLASSIVQPASYVSEPPTRTGAETSAAGARR